MVHMDRDVMESAVRECTRCALCESRTNAVPGIGTGRARIMFVGEAPGRSEDLRGRPFVGRAGQILGQALERSGITRESVYITNIVKCRPPKNRVPHQSEREACRIHLEREIQAINPYIICVMGNTAYRSLLGGTGITSNRGKTIQRDGHTYYITVHPAAAIYNRDLEGVLTEDIGRISAMIHDMETAHESPA